MYHDDELFMAGRQVGKSALFLPVSGQATYTAADGAPLRMDIGGVLAMPSGEARVPKALTDSSPVSLDVTCEFDPKITPGFGVLEFLLKDIRPNPDDKGILHIDKVRKSADMDIGSRFWRKFFTLSAGCRKLAKTCGNCRWFYFRRRKKEFGRDRNGLWSCKKLGFIGWDPSPDDCICEGERFKRKAKSKEAR